MSRFSRINSGVQSTIVQSITRSNIKSIMWPLTTTVILDKASPLLRRAISDFSNAILHVANISKAIIKDSKFYNAELFAINARMLTAARSDFSRVYAEAGDFSDSKFDRSSMEGGNFMHAFLDNGKIVSIA